MACLEWPTGQRYLLKGHSVTIGRDQANDLVLDDDTKVSRSHAELQFRDGQWLLLDLDSRNGTTVNMRRIGQHPLRDGDRIQLGGIILVYLASDDPNATDVGIGVRRRVSELSARERQVVMLLAQGLTDREIGEQLFISVSTVRSHLDRVAEKTGFRRRAELTRLAVEFGFVD